MDWTWISVGVAALVVGVYIWLTWNYDYWKKRGIPYMEPTIGLGNVHDYVGLFNGVGINKCISMLSEMSNKYGLAGFFNLRQPSLFISNPDYIRDITIKDFDHFVNPRSFGGNDGLTNLMLFNNKDQEWRDLRATITPAFTSSRMREMAPMMEQIALRLSKRMEQHGSRKDGLDIKDACGRYTMDTIASVAFNFECNSFEEEDPLFANKAKSMLHPQGLELWKSLVAFMLPSVTNATGLYPNKDGNRFFTSIVKQVLKGRYEGETQRVDFLQLLLETVGLVKGSKKKSVDNKPAKNITESDIVAQAVMFLAFGYGTTAITLMFVNWMIAIHQEIQQDLHDEVTRVLENHNGELSHESVAEMHLLEAVINETLRMYPLAPFIERICNKEYKLGDSGVTIPKDMLVSIGIWPMHRSTEYWTDPHVFDPQRFMPENKGNIKPYTYCPFGAGPRMCVGMRLAYQEMKIALAVIVRDLELTPAPSTHLTVFDLPLDSSEFVTSPKTKMFIKCQRRR